MVNELHKLCLNNKADKHGSISQEEYEMLLNLLEKLKNFNNHSYLEGSDRIKLMEEFISKEDTRNKNRMSLFNIIVPIIDKSSSLLIGFSGILACLLLLNSGYAYANVAINVAIVVAICAFATSILNVIIKPWKNRANKNHAQEDRRSRVKKGNNIFTDILPTFLKGFASAFDITGQTLLNSHDFSTGFKRDVATIRGDWQQVGNSFRKAIEDSSTLE